MNDRNESNLPEPDETAPESAETAESTESTERGEAAPGPAGEPRRKPIGFWLRTVDRLIAAEFAELFAAEGLTRGDWRRLNLIAGTFDDPRMAERLASRPEKLDRLIERGWVAGDAGSLQLTDAGREAYESLLERVNALRARVAGAVDPEAFATTMASLEAIAREFGYAEGRRAPHGRGFGRRRGGRPGFRPGFGAGFGPAEAHGFHDREFGGREFPGREFPGREFPGRGFAGRGFPGERDANAWRERHGGHGGHGRPGERDARCAERHGHEGHDRFGGTEPRGEGVPRRRGRGHGHDVHVHVHVHGDRRPRG